MKGLTLLSTVVPHKKLLKDNNGQQCQPDLLKAQGHVEKVVSCLTECKMQEQDLADEEAREKKELNVALRNLEQEEEEIPDILKEKVDELFLDQLETSVVCASAKCMQKGRGTAPGILVVQFEKKQRKITEFKARSKLTGTPIGLDDDLKHLQQQRKDAAWPAFKDFRSKGIRTRWRAEKLFVKEGERFVEHKVITAVYKSGDKGDMRNYQGITVGSVIAKSFAMILGHRIAVWAEAEGIKAEGQADFRKDFCNTDNIFVLESLIDKQKQTYIKSLLWQLVCHPEISELWRASQLQHQAPNSPGMVLFPFKHQPAVLRKNSVNKQHQG